MYLNTTVKIPEQKGKIIAKKKGDTTYIRKGQILRPTPNTAPLICGACYSTQPEDLLTMA
mgnify:CR=1 FL=1